MEYQGRKKVYIAVENIDASSKTREDIFQWAKENAISKGKKIYIAEIIAEVVIESKIEWK